VLHPYRETALALRRSSHAGLGLGWCERDRVMNTFSAFRLPAPHFSLVGYSAGCHGITSLAPAECVLGGGTSFRSESR